MKKHKVVLVLLSVASMLSLCACGEKSTINEHVEESQQEVVKEETSVVVVQETVEVLPVEVPLAEAETKLEETSSEEESDDFVITDELLTELSDDMDSFQVSFDGAVVQLPTTYSVMEQLGFIMDDKIHDFGDGYSVEMWKDKFGICTFCNNYGNEEADIKECAVTVITASSYKGCDMEILLPKGIQLGVSTYDDIIAAYGEPDRIDKSREKYIDMYYDISDNQYIEVQTYTDTGILCYFAVENNKEPELTE